MTSSLDAAVTEITAAGDSRPVLGRTLSQLTTRIAGALNGILARLDVAEPQIAANTQAVTAADTRLDALEAALPSFTITGLTNVSQLPATAPINAWFRVRGDSNVYVGNGATLPLTKLQTVPLP